MEKTEMVSKLKELRNTLKEKQIELVKGTLKDTSVLKKAKREIASLVTKLSAMQHGA